MIYKVKITYKVISQYSGYEFHVLVVYLHPTFTVTPIGGAFGIQSNICGGFFYRNSGRVKTVGYFCRKAPSWMLHRMFDRILYVTLPYHSSKKVCGQAFHHWSYTRES